MLVVNTGSTAICSFDLVNVIQQSDNLINVRKSQCNSMKSTAMGLKTLPFDIFSISCLIYWRRLQDDDESCNSNLDADGDGDGDNDNEDDDDQPSHAMPDSNLDGRTFRPHSRLYHRTVLKPRSLLHHTFCSVFLHFSTTLFGLFVLLVPCPLTPVGLQTALII